MIKALLFIFAVNAAAAAETGPVSCLNLLSTRAAASRTASEANFRSVVDVIRAAGGSGLLAPLESGEIRLTFKGFRMPWQSMISGRQSLLGGRTLKVRGLEFSNEKEKQEAVWSAAMALFELQTRASLWSYRAMMTPDGQREFDLSMSGSDESFEYFMLSQPREWRDRQLALLERLENELYALFASLTELKAGELLPKKDPGRFWKLRSVYGGDASRSIAPNQADFARWQSGARPELRARHGGSVLFNYYMSFMKRAIVLSLAAQVAMAAPELRNVPSYLDAMFSVSQFSQELSESPAKTEELNRRYVENLKKQVVREEERLKKAIASEKAKPSPDAALVRSLELELSELYDLYPWLAHR